MAALAQSGFELFGGGDGGGKRWASGRDTTSTLLLHVRGLPFRPSVVIAKLVENNNYVRFSVYVDPGLLNSPNGMSVRVGSGSQISQINTTIFEDGFEIGTYVDGVYDWIAFE